MPINLTTNFNLPGGARLVVDRPSGAKMFDEDAEILRVAVELRLAAATNALIVAVLLEITNVESDKIARQATPAVGLNIDDRDRYFVRTKRATPTGYTDAMNAWKAGATPAARKSALEAHMLAAGHIDATSLAGT